MPTTEIATLALVPGSEIGDPNNPAAGVLKDAGDTLSKTDGQQQLHFGMGIENPTTLQMFIEWDSKKHHEDFMQSAEYGPFLRSFKTILAESPHIIHVDFKGGLKAALSAPVTEIATLYHESAPPSDAESNAAKLKEIVDKEAPGTLLGYAYGISHEELEADGKKGKVAVAVIGWPTKEAHMSFRGTELFKDNINLLRNGAHKIEMHHTQFMNFVAS